MRAINTPSIARQRIILVVFFAVIGALAWRQDADDRLDFSVQKFSPTSVSGAELDFTNAEAGWSELQVDSQGNLRIDALTETALVDAIAFVRESPDPAMVRMAFLLEKQFGATASQQIMELLPKLKQYKEAERRWWEQNQSKSPPPLAELFQLQDALLGPTLAEKMLSEQRRLMSMMLASQQIRNDTRLTQTEKDQALLDLQKTMQDEEGASVE